MGETFKTGTASGLENLKKYRWVFLFGAVLLVGTIIFKIDGGIIDKLITDYFYDASLPLGERFYLEHAQPWHFLNKYNKGFEYFFYLTIIPMILAGIIWHKKAAYLLRYGGYAFCSVFTSALLLVNMLLKNFYGRPRPRQTLLWSNELTEQMWNFYSVCEPVFLKDPSLINVGKSFPSGHVTIVAAYIVFFFIFKRPDVWATLIPTGRYASKKLLFEVFKWAGLGISILVGFLTGIGRIAAGAHYASDVLWAFGIVYIVNAFFYYVVFRLPRYEEKITRSNLMRRQGQTGG
jgi:membrane-associated phospholipid phosphatase